MLILVKFEIKESIEKAMEMDKLTVPKDTIVLKIQRYNSRIHANKVHLKLE